jgi:hypothetical protein
MRILTQNDAAEALGTPDIASFFGGVIWQYPDPVPSYFLPKDSGAKLGVARTIANTFLDAGPTVLWINDAGVWPSAEHMDLFSRYRLSHGERRTLSEAPVHIFESIGDRDAFISILCLSLFFVWGVEITNLDRSRALTISHDEWLEYRYAPGHEAFVPYFREWIEPSRCGSLAARCWPLRCSVPHSCGRDTARERQRWLRHRVEARHVISRGLLRSCRRFRGHTLHKPPKRVLRIDEGATCRISRLTFIKCGIPFLLTWWFSFGKLFPPRKASHSLESE